MKSLFYIILSLYAILGMQSHTYGEEDQEVNASSKGKSNIVLILADDLDISTSEYWERVDELVGTPASNCNEDNVTEEMSCDPLAKTRKLIKDQGITFKNAFVTTALCCSMRASLETGRYAHNTGVITNGGDVGGYSAFVKYGNLDKTLAVYLEEQGYRTALVGKYLNGISEVKELDGYPPGWTDFYMFNGGSFYDGYNYSLFEKSKDTVCESVEDCTHNYYQGEEAYSTDVLADKAVDFISEVAESEEPFFLYLTPTAPHFPLMPANRHQKHPYYDAEVSRELWPSYMEEDVTDKSIWLQKSVYARSESIRAFNDSDYKLRQGTLYALDDLVEKVIEQLDSLNMLDNTYVIFAGDNGYNLGAHYLLHKMSPYEESIRVPFVMRGPGIQSGLVNTNLALIIDLVPTISEIASIDIENKKFREEYDSKSLMPLFGKSYVPLWRSDFMNEYMVGAVANGIGAEAPPAFWWLVGQDVPSYRAIRTEKFSYVEWYHGDELMEWNEHQEQLVWDTDRIRAAGEELYDLHNDPFELNNLLATDAGEEACSQVAEVLSARLDELTYCRGDTCRELYTYPNSFGEACQAVAEMPYMPPSVE